MATVALSEVDESADIGRLSSNYTSVMCLQTSLSRSDLNLNSVPKVVKMVIAEGAWREFALPDGRVIRNASDFRRFIESPRPEGCETPIHVLRHMVAGTDVADEVEQLLRGKPGGANGREIVKDEITGRFAPTINRNNVTDDGEPSVIPFDVPAPRVRDYARESKQGNSVGYTLRRLEKDAPELLAQVKAGELSPYAAAVKAGIRDRLITVPSVPRKAARVLLRHFQGEALAELVDALSQAVEF